MESQTKRTLAATALCLLLLFAWTQYMRITRPPAQNSTPAQSTGSADNPSAAAVQTVDPTSGPAGDGRTVTAAEVDGAITVVGDENAEAVTIGSDIHPNPAKGVENPYLFSLKVSPVGASVESLRLSQYRASVAKDPKNPTPDPYEFLRGVVDPKSQEVFRSFACERLYLPKIKKEILLGGVPWNITRGSDEKGEFVSLSVLVKEGQLNLARVTKTYHVDKSSPMIRMSYDVENLSTRPQDIRLTETGPTGFMREDLRYDHVRVVAAAIDADGRVKVAEHPMRSEIYKSPEHRRDLTLDPDRHFIWAALSNKYFTCIVTPMPAGDGAKSYPDYWAQLSAKTRLDGEEFENDLTTVQVYAAREPIPAGGRQRIEIEAYCGPKSDRAFEAVPVAMARHYPLTMSVDRSMCTFDFFNTAMHWLLDFIHGIVGNYGIAIIFLVIIVRSLLHPITKKGQINMIRTQKRMAVLKPKLDALQEQYKNDKQKLAQEQFKLNREEGINPAGQMLGCLPMFLQMPIWVALYTTLNTNVDLRHAPFLGYIRDLSAPDTLIAFNTPIHIPLISSMMGGPITALNLLPIIMTLLMYGQQKLTQKLTKPDKPPEPKLDKDGNPLPDQMAQQQKIMSFMMIFMGFIFYNMPSGLCLYILCSSFLGMCEQWYIRKHIKEQEERGQFVPVVKGPGFGGASAVEGEPKPPRKPSWFERKLEEMQKLAEEQKAPQSKLPIPQRGKKKKKSRF